MVKQPVCLPIDRQSSESSLMPMTPFHMGIAMLVKPAANTRFSVIAFGISQVLIDLEPALGMLVGAAVLHGPSHTVFGALLVAAASAWITPLIAAPLLRRWNAEVTHYGLDWLNESPTFSKAAVWAGALFGTLSHIALDSLMHADMHPMAPLSNANPMMGLVGHDHVYHLCVVAGVFGFVVWLIGKRRSCQRSTKDNTYEK